MLSPDSLSPAALLEALRLGRAVGAPAAVVAAHPDDETLGLGLRLPLLYDLTLILVTDGAPAGREGEAPVRARELQAALAALGAAPRLVALGLQDQAACASLGLLVERLTDLLARAAMVLTHAYEGGHPDHDAAAFAVQLACDRLARRGHAPPVRLEFAGYHQGGAGRVAGRFWPDPARPPAAPVVTLERLSAKRAALACYRSQADVVAWFDPACEAYRQAPRYDFAAAPPPGPALYDGFGWPITGEAWRAQARRALTAEREAAA